MELTPSERDRLLIFTAAQVSAARRARGLLLNKPEAVSLIAAAVIEAARDGLNHAGAAAAGAAAVTRDQLMPGIASMLNGVSVEAVFDDGMRLVVVAPFTDEMDVPGQVIRATEVVFPVAATSVAITNTASVAISLTSHIHVFEANAALSFDRAAAYGMRPALEVGQHLDIPSGKTVEVGLIPIAGDRVVIGFAGFVDGPLDAPGAKAAALAKLRACGYLDSAGE